MKALLAAIALAALLVAGSFAWFIQTLPSTAAPITDTTDAIVVLTGGNGRVEQGLVALSQGAAPVLFISGAGHKVRLSEMIAAHSTADVRAAIAQRGGEVLLDHVASSTQSNATEAAAFVKARNIRSIRLVTAQYHMKRSLLEFHAAMPDVRIVPDPVFPEGFRRDEWWQDESSRRLVFSEYKKYFGALALRCVP